METKPSDASADASAPRVDIKVEAVGIPVSEVDRAKKFYGNPGANITLAAPGSARGLYLIVSDLEAARDGLAARGAEVSEVFDAGTPGGQLQREGKRIRIAGAALDHATCSPFATFSDSDANGWVLHEITARLPGHSDAARTAFTSAKDPSWPDWYASHMIAEQAGMELPR